MTHRAAQIVEAARAAIAEVVEPLGVKVFVHRRYTLDSTQDELPAISVDYGEDRKSDVRILAAIDSLLSVEITANALDSDESGLRSRLLSMRADVHQAITATPQLGLPFVGAIYYGGASAPELSPEGEQIHGALTSTWVVQYQMALDSAE